MGLGDVKMLGMIGAFLGPAGVLVTVLLASLAGRAVGLMLIAFGGGDRKMRLPFGVFLSLGGIATLFVGETLIRTYRSFWS
jgi:leader peptidase (prepilin peptidase)/N-methyltransferase